jgi:hypothetical protein
MFTSETYVGIWTHGSRSTLAAIQKKHFTAGQVGFTSLFALLNPLTLVLLFKPQT